MIKKLLYNLYINHSFKKIISKDNISISLKEKIRVNGLSEDSIKFLKDGVFEITDITVDPRSISEIDRYCDEKINGNLNRNSPVSTLSYVHREDSIAEKILSNKKINLLIKDYLGEDARLDMISLSITHNDTNNSIVSEKWHYDNVGRRIKLFYYLNDNDDICTDYVSGTNNLFHKSYTTDGSRVDEKLIKKFNGKINSYFPIKNKILIFDTNGYHRGNYKDIFKNKINKSRSSYRKMLKFEFSNSKKSELFFQKSNSIGVRGTFFSQRFNFQNCSMIDKNYLTKINGNYYFYDKEYKYICNS